jgi:hypothetical protein
LQGAKISTVTFTKSLSIRRSIRPTGPATLSITGQAVKLISLIFAGIAKLLKCGAPNPRLMMANVKGGREKYGDSKTMPIWKTEQTAKYAKYANPEAGGGNIWFVRVFRYFAVISIS